MKSASVTCHESNGAFPQSGDRKTACVLISVWCISNWIISIVSLQGSPTNEAWRKKFVIWNFKLLSPCFFIRPHLVIKEYTMRKVLIKCSGTGSENGNKGLRENKYKWRVLTDFRPAFYCFTIGYSFWFAYESCSISNYVLNLYGNFDC